MKSTRIFADIVINGPQNQQEAVILNAAKSLLEPHDFTDTIRSKDTVSGTLKRIDASVLKKMNLQMFVTYHMMLLQRQLDKKNQVTRIDDVLSKEFGTNNMTKILNAEPTKQSLAQIIAGEKALKGNNNGIGF